MTGSGNFQVKFAEMTFSEEERLLIMKV